MGDDRFDGQSLLNVGTVNTASGNLLFFNGASATNSADATWDLGSSGSSASITVVGPDQSFLNEGTLVVPSDAEGYGSTGQFGGLRMAIFP
jgi:hypothetical protein